MLRAKFQGWVWFCWIGLAAGFTVGCGVSGNEGSSSVAPSRTLLNVSYDPTRELYTEFNQAFAADWYQQHGERVAIDQSHGGSGKQARAVIEGLGADVVSLALSGDIDTIARRSDRIESDWQTQFPNKSSPYTSTIVFLVRKGNPKGIHDWGDLVGDKPVEVITSNPKTGGGARWNYLAAWGFALHRELGDWKRLRDPKHSEAVAAATIKAKEFLTQLYRRVPVLDTSARAATNTFLQRRIGDVLITWENEAYLALRELGSGEVEMVVPKMSIRAEPPVAVVSKNAAQHGTTDLAHAYLEYLYSDVGQRLVAKHFYRPRNTDVIDAQTAAQFESLTLFELTDVVSGWDEAQEVHFKERTGLFDQIYVGK